MKRITGINGMLSFTLLMAALFLPTQMNNQAMADTGLRVKDQTIECDHVLAGNDEEEYSISAIKFLN
jgi:hypothetical protein